uniref:TIR domain-containing protein n=1 Tax=Kalanchoe fedtschenkoi TaxID=63787 RepID=A0A7N1A4D7_KALFE
MAAAHYDVGQSSRQREQSAYDVFLSFRGEDIRKSFIDHLLQALTQRGIRVFYDDKSLERGYEIQLKLYEAIESSKIAIVTFSRGYAYSRWCLDELVKIMERRRSHGLIVLTVFYDVVPTIVRKQSGPYQEAFHEHEANYEDERVKKWRQALTAADLAGYEAQFIQNIVKEVETKLDDRQLAIPKYMVGANSLLIKEINKWLQNGSSQVEVGIIYGLGGVGKTTNAKVVYNKNYLRFESDSFLAGVINTKGSEHDFIRLQKQLIRNITGNEEIKIDSVHDGRQKIKKTIGTKKILVVFDDINEEVELNKMSECSDWFFPGSKILITTRNKHLLRNDKSVVARFESCVLDEKCSVELFSYHAFGQPAPPEDYTNIFMQFVEYCGGLPLALEVSASSLRSLSSKMWGEEFARLREYSDEKVNNVLKWSFNSLQHSTVKDIFLHITFYMVGMKREFALWILDGCRLHGKIGLENLISQCLVSVCEYSDTLMMHQLIQQMGYEVVRQESPIDLGRRSRLFSQKDAYEATPAIKGLFLNIPDALDNDISSDGSYAVHSVKHMRMTYTPTNPSRQVPQQFRSIKTYAFTKMNYLDLLLLENVKLEGGFEDFPKGIKWLLWIGCPLKEIPLNFYFDELVVLDMQKSCLFHAWSSSKYIRALKTLNLSHSHYLRSTPDLSNAHMLEWISCEGCTSLVEVHESMGKLAYLTYLNLDGCINLVTLPEFNGNFKKVITKFLVKGCINLRNLPINRLGYVELLDLDGCRSLFKSSNICPSLTLFDIFLPSLKKLSLTNFGISGDAVMEMVSHATSLESLNLSNNPIGVISNMNRRPCLKLTQLRLENCGISRVDDMGMMSLAPSLEYLDLSNNPICVMGDMSRSVCLKLKYLFLNNCPSLLSISNIFKDCWLEAEHSHSLKRITYFKGRRSIEEKQRHLIKADDCQQYVEIEYQISDAAIIERI